MTLFTQYSVQLEMLERRSIHSILQLFPLITVFLFLEIKTIFSINNYWNTLYTTEAFIRLIVSYKILFYYSFENKCKTRLWSLIIVILVWGFFSCFRTTARSKTIYHSHLWIYWHVSVPDRNLCKMHSGITFPMNLI